MKTQIFISYRRNTGLYLAKSIVDCLKEQGYSIFFDYSSMRNGEFNTQIFEAIEEADDVIFIWSEEALNNCTNTEDWVRQELLYAHSHNKHIIIVKDENSINITDLIQTELQFLKECPYIYITLDSFRDALTKLYKMLHARPISKLKRISKKYKLALCVILFIIGVLTVYISTPITTKEVFEEYSELTICIPKEYIDITDYVNEIESSYLGEADIAYADKKNYNEIIGALIDTEDLDPQSFLEDLDPETTYAILNKLQDKSLVEKETLSISEYAQCIEACFSIVPLIQNLKVYTKRIENEEVCFIEFTFRENSKLFKYKTGIFFKPDDTIEGEYTSYMIVAGCSENVNKLRQMKVFNTLNYIIKKLLQDNTFVNK